AWARILPIGPRRCVWSYYAQQAAWHGASQSSERLKFYASSFIGQWVPALPHTFLAFRRPGSSRRAGGNLLMVPAASEGLGLYTFVRALVRDLGPWWMKVSIHTLNAVFNGPRATLEHRHGFPAAPLLLPGATCPWGLPHSTQFVIRFQFRAARF